MQNKEDKYDMLLFALFSISVVIVIVCIIVGLISKANSKIYTAENMKFTEWISPDGVHYWIRETGTAGYMAVRYDSDGNIIIDKENSNGN